MCSKYFLNPDNCSISAKNVRVLIRKCKNVKLKEFNLLYTRIDKIFLKICDKFILQKTTIKKIFFVRDDHEGK